MWRTSYIYCWEDIIASKAILVLKTVVAASARGFPNKMTSKKKMRKRAGNKMITLIEKEVAASCSSNDSDSDVDIIFDENTSNNK